MWPEQKAVISSDLENVSQGLYLQELLYLSYYMTDFYQSFIENDGNVAGNKHVISLDLENVGQGHHLQKSLYLGYYTDDFNQTFTKMMLLGQETKASHPLTIKL